MRPSEEIKDKVGILDVVSPVVQLKRTGKNYLGLCPFHSEKTPSFVVSPEKGSYHCFGCGEGGDIFSFVMKTENLTFVETLQKLAARAGVELPEAKRESSGSDRIDRLLELMKAASEVFHNNLVSGRVGEGARSFLESRGVNSESVARFGLGYSVDSWDDLSVKLVARGYSIDELRAGGLIVDSSNGHYDRFRGRLIFPIRDAKGRTVGFGARTLSGGTPKFLNSPETEVFSKRNVLFGLDLAAPEIRRAGTAVVVEGYFDAVVAHQYGFGNTVAALGTAISDRQVGLLKRLTRNVTMALDPDDAGDEATLRGLGVMREEMTDRVVPTGTARGLMRLERKLDADLRVMSLPRGKDPDDVIRENPADWRDRMERALPLVDYYFAVLVRDLDLSTAAGKTQAVDRLAPIIGEIADPVQSWHYVQRLARLLQSNEKVIETAVKNHKRASTAKVAAPVAAESGTQRSGSRMPTEDYVVGLLVQHPELLDSPVRLELDDIRSAEAREVIGVLLARRGGYVDGQAGSGGATEVFEGSREYVEHLLLRMEQEPPIPDHELEKTAAVEFAKLRRLRYRERIAWNTERIRAAEAEGLGEEVRRLAAENARLMAESLPYERLGGRGSLEY